jgi:sodium pump decarboxylase gamma subunit
MLDNLISALEITLIGMGLVFLAILLLWGVMAGMIRILEERKEPAKRQPSPEEKKTLPDVATETRKMRAAVVAVACTLATSRLTPREFPLPPTAFVSAWQAVARSNMLRRGRVR